MPIVLLSETVANIYISVYNAASPYDVDYIYSIPWGKLISAALWFTVLSCLFVYAGTYKLMSEAPFILISSSHKGNLPFVKDTAWRIMWAKDKIKSLALVTAMRNIKSDLVMAVVTSLTCIVCGVFIALLAISGGNLSRIDSLSKRYLYDAEVSMKYDTVYARQPVITERTKNIV